MMNARSQVESGQIFSFLCYLLLLFLGSPFVSSPANAQYNTPDQAKRLDVKPAVKEIGNQGMVPFVLEGTLKEGWHLQANQPLEELKKVSTLNAFSEEGTSKQFPGYKTDEGLFPTYIEVIAPDGARLDHQKFSEGHAYEVPGFGRLNVLSGTFHSYGAVKLDSVPEPGSTVSITFRIVGQACDDQVCLPPGFWTREITLPVTAQKPKYDETLLKKIETKLDTSFRLHQASKGERKTTQDDQENEENNSNQITGISGTKFLEELREISEQIRRTRSDLKNELQKRKSDRKSDEDTNQNYESGSYSPPNKPPEEVVKSLGLTIQSNQKGVFQKKIENSLWLALLAAFIWGLAASLSPCVYPMIPLTLSFFGAQTGGDEDVSFAAKQFRLISMALVFVFGVTMTFSVLGVAAAMLNFEMGSVLGSPWFVGFLIFLFIFLSLWMMGYYELPVPSSLKRVGQNRQGYLGALIMGLMLGVIAAPCVGPFAAAILAFITATGDITLGFLSMASFGLGLGMLFLVLAIFGGEVQSLGTGGAWLKHVKSFFGFVLLGTTIYFLDLFLNLINAGEITYWLIPLLTGFFGIVLGFWLWQVIEEQSDETTSGALGPNVIRAASILTVITGVYFSMAAVVRSEALVPAPDWWKPARNVQSGVQFIPNFEAGVKKAKKENKPFFIDFYADWCIPCKKMDQEVFSDPQVAKYVNQNFVPIKLDVTEGNSWNTKLKFEVFDTAGIPYVAFFDANGNYLSEISKDGKIGKEEFLRRAKEAQKATPGGN